MSQTKKSEIEKRIQQLSMELEKDLLEQMQQKVEQKLDMKKLEEMVLEWWNLYRYYRDRNYSDDESEKDLDISIFIIKNYLYWTDYCQIQMGVYANKGQMDIAEEFDEALNSLEGFMKKIIETVRDFDDYEA